LIARGIQNADEKGAAFWQLNGRLWQASFMAFDGSNPQLARDMLTSLLPQATAVGVGIAAPIFLTALAYSHVALNNINAALDCTTKAFAQVQKQGDGLYAPFACHLHAQLLRHAGQIEGARRVETHGKLYQARSGTIIAEHMFPLP